MNFHLTLPSNSNFPITPSRSNFLIRQPNS
ncbi:unnamed protein product, partial [Rotaria sordida]